MSAACSNNNRKPAIGRGSDITSARSAVADQIRAKVRMVVADEQSFGVLSTGEKIAVALVLDRYDLVQFWGTVLESVNRVGDEWLIAALCVQREGWG